MIAANGSKFERGQDPRWRPNEPCSRTFAGPSGLSRRRPNSSRWFRTLARSSGWRCRTRSTLRTSRPCQAVSTSCVAGYTSPEFGASENVASMLLTATATNADVRGALNLATSEPFLRAAREGGIEPFRFEPDYEHRQERLEDRFREGGGVPSVCYTRATSASSPSRTSSAGRPSKRLSWPLLPQSSPRLSAERDLQLDHAVAPRPQRVEDCPFMPGNRILDPSSSLSNALQTAVGAVTVVSQ
jgi:hypothetical protein